MSSVIEGLQDCRQAIVDVGNRLNNDGLWFSVVRADVELAASNSNPMDVCYDGIDDCNICLCILGSRYGTVHPETNLSISEMEFDYARERGKEILCFVLDSEMEEPQRAFRDKLGNLIDGKFYKKVTSLDGLILECSEALRAWARTKPPERTAEAFRSYSTSLLSGIVDELPGPIGRIDRPELDTVLKLLSNMNSVLLVGDKGSGKSGILKSVCARADKSGIPVLALAPSTYPRTATALTFLEQALSLPGSLHAALLEVADRFGRVYVVADQLDFVRDTELGRTLVHALLAAATQPGVCVLAASRTYDSQRDELWSLRAAGFEVVELSPLPTSQVEAILSETGLKHPADAVVRLGRNLLLLSLITHLILKEAALHALTEAIDLWDAFVESMRATEGEEAFARATVLARDGLLAGGGDLVPLLPLDTDMQKLIACGIVTQLPFDRLRFRHEELQFFLYARDVVRNGLTAVDVTNELSPQVAERALPYVQLLKRKLGPEHEADLLREVFDV